ncbi:carboxylate-amine ligase [Compostimonas suwonensis]|uniref:carboxylate-amine ligase n=1 Tax=Compostimonas suwonensis TaxID=1048394 RepID=UPI0012FDD8D4|nr:YbdK family carboxylate-amine ligase [Compostimonas suwonensis]
MTAFGVEEEFILLDPAGLGPRYIAREVIGRLSAAGEHAQEEFLACQVECATSICSSLEQAAGELAQFRRELGSIAREQGAVAAATGAPFTIDATPTITEQSRYLAVAAEQGAITREHIVNGMHVHVEIPDRESGVHALNALRSWLPTIVALSGNSPFWQGDDSAFASWRTIQMRRWTTQGCPPHFADAADYAARTENLVGLGGTTDIPLIAWNARLSSKHPTLEVRASDAQLTVRHAVTIAGAVRGLVVRALADLAEGRTTGADAAPPPEVLESAVWHAARYGTRSMLVDPRTGELVAARVAVEALLAHAEPALVEEGDLEEVGSGLERLLSEGTGADAQREAYRRGGVPALASLFAESLVE